MAHYSIKVLETGYDTAFPAGIAFDFWHMGDQQAYSPFAVTLLQGEGHNILFDCGFDDSDYAKNRIAMEHDQNCHGIAEVLRANGLAPEEIDAVVLSHCHWDHLCGLSQLPKAKFYVQRAELENWERALSTPDFPMTHTGVVSPAGLKLLRAYADQGRAVLLDGDVDELFPGISVRTAKGHSFAQNMLFLALDAGRFAIIGDVAMRPESFTGTEAFPCFLPNLKFSVGTIEDICASYRRILDWVGGDATHIIPTHDGTRQETWPTVRNALDLAVTTICP